MQGKMGALLSTLVLVAACGGASTTNLVGQPDGGGTGPGPGPCPAAPPSSGTSCSGTLACEYGADPDVSCDTVATCESGTWDLEPAPATPCSTVLDPTCPASYAALLSSKTCEPVGTSCTYAEARCSCATHCDMVGMSTPFWCCPDGPSGVAGCPSPRPRLGSSCANEGTVCDYGGCTGNVTLQCSGGTWQPTMVGCPG
jgi:hypothetical protein